MMCHQHPGEGVLGQIPKGAGLPSDASSTCKMLRSARFHADSNLAFSKVVQEKNKLIVVAWQEVHGSYGSTSH